MSADRRPPQPPAPPPGSRPLGPPTGGANRMHFAIASAAAQFEKLCAAATVYVERLNEKEGK